MSRWASVWLGFIAGLLLTAGPSPGAAADGQPLRSASELDYPPFALVTADGEADGFAVELLRAAAAAVGRRVEFAVGPWHQLKQDLAEGRLDVLPLVARTRRRAQIYDFSIPYLSMHGAIVVRPDERGTRSLDDLEGKSVVVMRGDIGEEYVLAHNPEQSLIATRTLEEGLRRLAAGEGAAMVVQALAGRKLIRELGLSLQLADDLLPHYQDFCFAVQTGDSALLAILNEGLALVIADGTLDELKVQWLGPIEEPQPMLWGRILAAILFSLILAYGVAWLWNRSLVRRVMRRTAELAKSNHQLAVEIQERQQIEADLRRHREELERRVAERTAALQASEQYYRLLVEQALDGIFVSDGQGRYLDVNSAGAAMLGYSREEILHRSIADVIDPSEIPRIPYEVGRFADGSTTRTEWLFRRKDGSTFPGEVVARQLPDGRLQAFLRDISEWRRVEAALRESDRQKDRFLATLAHELRNPLAPIRNAVELLRLQPDLSSVGQNARAIIDRQVTHMVRLIDDLLDISRISRGVLHLHKERIDLQGVLEQALESSRSNLERAGHHLELDLGPGPLFLDADPVRLSQVFLNLLNNAGKYTEPDGHIRLSVAAGDGWARVSVRDNGIGIRADDLPKLFEMFSQLDGDSIQGRGGLGIGLSLAATLTELHGGRIEVHSDGPGTGSEFIVHLPLAAAPAARPVDDPPPVAANRDGPARHILVVDDNRDARDSLALLLQVQGHEVATAGDGQAAVEAAERLRPALILLDLGMPVMDGYTACRHIREQSWGRDLRIVAMSGWGQEEDLRKTRANGFDDHLVKPVQAEDLNALLAGLATPAV